MFWMGDAVENQVIVRFRKNRLNHLKDLDEEKGGKVRNDCKNWVRSFARETSRVGMGVIIHPVCYAKNTSSRLFRYTWMIVEHSRDSTYSNVCLLCDIVNCWWHVFDVQFLWKRFQKIRIFFLRVKHYFKYFWEVLRNLNSSDGRQCSVWSSFVKIRIL